MSLLLGFDDDVIVVVVVVVVVVFWIKWVGWTIVVTISKVATFELVFSVSTEHKREPRTSHIQI